NDVVVDHMHQPWRTFVDLINKTLFGKTTGLNKLRLFRAQIIWGKLKRVKRPAKKSTEAPVRGVVIRETYEIPLNKKKEKVDVTQDSSGEDSDQENDSDDDQTQSNNENESDSEHETDESESGSESDHEENEKDETIITDKAEDKEMDYTTSQLYDDVDIKLNEPVNTDKGFVQEESTDATMTNVQQRNENPEILQVIKDAHVTLFTIPKKTEVLVTNSSHSSELVAKFLNFLDIPYTDAEIVSLMDVHVHHEVPSQQTPTLLIVPVSLISDSSPIFSTTILQSLPSFTHPPQQSISTPPPTTKATNPPSTILDFASVFQFNNRVTSLEKEVFELKKDPLHTQVITLVNDHLDARLGATRDEFMNFLSASLTARIIEQVNNQLPHILPEERSRKYKGDDPFAGSDRGLKKRKTSKDAEPAKGPKAKESQSGSSKGDKSQSKSFGKSVQTEEPEFERNTSKDAEPRKGPKAKESQSGSSKGDKSQSKSFGKSVQSEEPEFEYDFEECYKALSEKLDWENPEGGDYPFDLTKPLPLVMNGNCQMVLVDYFFKNDLKYLQGGISTMTYMTSLTKTKAAQYDLPGIEEMRVENLQLAVKSYQKKINITKPETTRPGIRKKDPYTPYQDHQGFIYVDILGRKRLMRLDELYKFNDGTLTRLRTNNIHMEYLAKRRWSTSEKKRANIMIKAIDKQLKERRMMRSLENHNRGDLSRDIPLDSVEVLRYEKRSKVRLRKSADWDGASTGTNPTRFEL
nr:hypothetical protein [Tanacetum cinerariifolium]